MGVRKNTGPIKNGRVKLKQLLMYQGTSVSFVPALHLLPPSTPFWPYGTHPFFPHDQNISILSDLLYSLTPFYSSSAHLFTFNSIHSWHSNQTSQTLHLTFLLSALLIPHASAPYKAVGTITPSYRHFLAFYWPS